MTSSIMTCISKARHLITRSLLLYYSGVWLLYEARKWGPALIFRRVYLLLFVFNLVRLLLITCALSLCEVRIEKAT